MKRLLMAAAVAFGMSGAAVAQTVMDQTGVGHDAEVAALFAELQTQLNDGYSAMIRNLRFYPGLVCGELNARNTFGGYAGFAEFYFDPAARLPGRRLAIGRPGEGLVIIRTRCNSAAGG